ncbi:hypothetical protein, partial [Bacillus subtilis]|uniref:hypothetical protein n=1 Tax=Bacillus subtilis TaxID=1423 RepID=UPI001BDB9832
LLYQVIKELHIASLSKVFGYAKPKFISHLPLDYRLSHAPGRRLLSDNALKFVLLKINKI